MSIFDHLVPAIWLVAFILIATSKNPPVELVLVYGAVASLNLFVLAVTIITPK